MSALAKRPALAVLTGAGVSAESGIPTFREAQSGLWARFSPQDLATPEAFLNHPLRIWDWYRWRRELVSQGGPNAAHLGISELQNRLKHCAIITQNVDGLQQRAGATHVIELHGNLWRQRCVAGCGFTETVATPGAGRLPYCPNCTGILRPDVVWFGEALPQQAFSEASAAITGADIVIVAGTSNLVYPAAALLLEALRLGKTVVEINPERTPLSSQADYFIQAPASVALPAIRDICLVGAQPST